MNNAEEIIFSRTLNKADWKYEADQGRSGRGNHEDETAA
jgi:hypothetical protein